MAVEAPGELILSIGKYFLNRPYTSETLERKGKERLVVNLREFDCMTFVENVIALGRELKSGKESFDSFRASLKNIRYRNGRLEGYSSRLHYFSDWIRNNEQKRFLREITAQIGGTSLKKPLTFMTAHPDLYPSLKDKANLLKMKSIERSLSRRAFPLLRKEELTRLQDEIRDGDLIAIVTDVEGLDIQHVGFAMRAKKRIHLLHASSKEGKVVLSTKTLRAYLMESKRRSGIRVVRIEPFLSTSVSRPS